MSGRKARAGRTTEKIHAIGPTTKTGGNPFSLPFAGQPDIAHFYLPVLDPLRTPDLYQFPVAYVWNPADTRPCFQLPDQGKVQYASRQILIFHQRTVPLNMDPVLAALQIMGEEGRSFGMSDTQGTEPLRATTPLTIVEVVAVLDPESADPLSDAFDEAVKTIAEFQTYYHLETKVPVRRLTRKALPSFIPVLRRPFGESAAMTTTLMLVNDGDPSTIAAVAQEVPAERLNGLLAQSHHQSIELFKPFVLMRQEAQLAYRTGGYAAAALFCAIAAETLLTEVLLMLLWEEDLNRERVAVLLGARDNISKPLLGALADRLGGNWDRNGCGPLGRWQSDTANLRNEVAHQGKIPSESEMQATLQAVQGLEAFVGDRLAERKNFIRYSQTAFVFLGHEGFERRGKARFWRELAMAQIFPVHVSQLFQLWKSEVEWLRTGTRTADETRATPTLVAYPNGAKHWYLVDDEVNLACEIGEPNLEPEIRGSLQKVLINSEFDVLSIAVKTSVPLLPESAIWRPSYEVLPLRSIHRWEQCLWKPPPTII